MIYLLDADVLINAERDYYPRKRVPEFWEWLLHHAESGTVKTLKRISAGLKQTPSPARPEDPLSEWIRAHEASLTIGPPSQAAVLRVWTDGYQQGSSALHLPSVDDDAFLIAADCAGRADGGDDGETLQQDRIESTHSTGMRHRGRELHRHVSVHSRVGFPDGLARKSLSDPSGLSPFAFVAVSPHETPAWIPLRLRPMRAAPEPTLVRTSRLIHHFRDGIALFRRAAIMP